MKVEVTSANILSEADEVIAQVHLVDDVCVKVDIRLVLGWNDWLDLTDAVRRVMLLMEVKRD